MPRTQSNPLTVSDVGEILQFYNSNEGSHFTCVGYAPSKRRRCHNPINCANRAHATRLLARISTFEGLDELSRLLRELAGTSLCKAWHQDQKESVAEMWYRAMLSWMRRNSHSASSSHRSTQNNATRSTPQRMALTNSRNVELQVTTASRSVFQSTASQGSVAAPRTQASSSQMRQITFRDTSLEEPRARNAEDESEDESEDDPEDETRHETEHESDDESENDTEDESEDDTEDESEDDTEDESEDEPENDAENESEDESPNVEVNREEEAQTEEFQQGTHSANELDAQNLNAELIDAKASTAYSPLTPTQPKFQIGNGIAEVSQDDSDSEQTFPDNVLEDAGSVAETREDDGQPEQHLTALSRPCTPAHSPTDHDQRANNGPLRSITPTLTEQTSRDEPVLQWLQLTETPMERSSFGRNVDAVSGEVSNSTRTGWISERCEGLGSHDGSATSDFSEDWSEVIYTPSRTPDTESRLSDLESTRLTLNSSSATVPVTPSTPGTVLMTPRTANREATSQISSRVIYTPIESPVPRSRVPWVAPLMQRLDSHERIRERCAAAAERRRAGDRQYAVEQRVAAASRRRSGKMSYSPLK